MKTVFFRTVCACLVVAIAGFPGIIAATQHSENSEQLSGFYSRAGNNGSPAAASGNNIYIKFFSDRWIAMLFVPYPSAGAVDPSSLERVFEKAKLQATGAAYIRGDFGELSELATLQIERYGYLEDRIVFECGSLAPCTLKLGSNHLDLVRPGMINEHITRYEHVATD